jgi:prevent-host-death family protein
VEVEMESVNQREMRNRSGEVLRRVAEGESFLVTNNGTPAAMLIPVASDARARLVASGRLRAGTGLDLSALPSPPSSDQSTGELLSEDRGR